MENINDKNKKQDNKYILLEKPMFFNSKLNNQDKNLNNEQKPPSQNKDNNKKIETKENAPYKLYNNSNTNYKKESPKGEMKFRTFYPNQMKQNGVDAMAGQII